MSDCPYWNDDSDESLDVVAANLEAVIWQVQANAARREPPRAAEAQAWHERIYQGVPLPVPYYAGGLRGDLTLPCLRDYEVRVGIHAGADSSDVANELLSFESSMQAATNSLDQLIPGMATTTDELQIGR